MEAFVLVRGVAANIGTVRLQYKGLQSVQYELPKKSYRVCRELAVNRKAHSKNEGHRTIVQRWVKPPIPCRTAAAPDLQTNGLEGILKQGVSQRVESVRRVSSTVYKQRRRQRYTGQQPWITTCALLRACTVYTRLH